MEREANTQGEPGPHPEQVQRHTVEEEAVESFEHGDAEWYAVLGED
ncbi:hypothetical protein ACFYNO_13980 [Kitasatospora sp. NPDC006697]